MEAEWRAYLPDFLAEGWRTNVLSSYDLAPGVALYDAGRYDEALDFFTRSEQLYRDLGRSDRAAEANRSTRRGRPSKRTTTPPPSGRRARPSGRSLN
jgi:hypothetical protein